MDFLQQMLNCNEEGSPAPILEDDTGLAGKSAAEHIMKEEHRKGLYFGGFFFSNIFRIDLYGQ